MNSDCRIPEHRLRAGCRNHDILVSAHYRVTDVPEKSLGRNFLNLKVRNDCLTRGAPVHHALAPIDPAATVEPHEGLKHRPAVALVQSKSRSMPVIRATKAAELFQNGPSILFGPAPDSAQHLVSAHIPAVLPLFPTQLLFHFHLGRNTGMVGPGQTKGVVAPHAPESNNYVMN